MPELTQENIGRISIDVKKQEIIFSHLPEELIDHICCDVESEMQNGLTFLEAYRRVKQKMHPRRLKEIQEETLYAVDLKYRYMKNTMKISGIAGTILFSFAALFKIQHWAGAGVMMTLGAIVLTFVFMPSALGVLWKETHSRKRLFLFISAFFAGTFFILGTLFKIQHWSGAGIILILAMASGVLLFIPALVLNRFSNSEKEPKRPVYIAGALGLICFITGMLFKIQHWPSATFLIIFSLLVFSIVLPWYAWVTWKEESYINSRFLFMVIGTVVLLVPGTMINLNLQYAYEDGFYPNLEQQQAMYDYLSRNNNTLIASYSDSSGYQQIEQVHSRTTGLLALISKIQVKMVQESEGEPGRPAISQDQIRQTESDPQINYRLLSKPFHPAPVRDFLLSGSSSRLELNTALKEYKMFVSALMPDADTAEYANLLESSTYLPDDGSDGSSISMISGLHSLELLKNAILTVEADILKTFANPK